MNEWVVGLTNGCLDKCIYMHELQKEDIILPAFLLQKVIQKIISATCVSVLQNASGDPAVSSTVNPLTTKRSKVKTEAEGPLPISPSSQVRESKNSGHK